MSAIIGSAVSTLIASQLPFDNSTNIALGMAGGQLISLSLGKFSDVTGWLWQLLGKNVNTIKIHANEGGRYNPIYKKMEEYILQKYTERLIQCNLEPLKGEVSIGLREAMFKKPITVNYSYKNNQTHQMYLSLSTSEASSVETNDSDKSSSSSSSTSSSSTTKSGKTIIITSKTATIDVVKSFVTEIVKLEQTISNTLTVYRAVGLKKDQTPHWDCLRFKSNKTMENTILKAETEEQLFHDIDWFMNNETWYTTKGIDYKRGYMLYGPPGTGKSSCIKSIANKYGISIFNIDLESIKTNNQLITLANDILYEASDKPYILAIEDFDRHEMFTDKWNYSGRSKKVTLQCLLNVIDGVVESHGRILIITCNDKEPIENISALVRPGRIDRIIEVGVLNGEQASKFLNNYFDSEITIQDDNIEDNITPAQLIKIMQTTKSLKKSIVTICKQFETFTEYINTYNENNGIIDHEPITQQLIAEDKKQLIEQKTNQQKHKKRRNRWSRRKNPGKNAAEKKAWTIKQKEQKINNIITQNTKKELITRKLELELEYDRKIYDELKEKQDKRNAAKKEKEKLKKQREKKKKSREQKQNQKRKFESIDYLSDEDEVIKTKDVSDDDDDDDDNKEFEINMSYTTRSGRKVKKVCY